MPCFFKSQSVYNSNTFEGKKRDENENNESFLSAGC